MSEVKVNKISPRTNCGTVQLGDSGDTITIPSGATITNNGTQTGFGRTGTVDWNTTKITADPANAVSGTGYFTDTSSAAFNVTLPSSPSAGDIVAVADYSNTWDTNNLTIVRNGSNIEGEAENFVCNTEGSSITLVYVDATKGWITVNSGNSSQAGQSLFICASGGTETTSGDFKIHTFTGPGTFTVNAISETDSTRNEVSYMVVAGGGSGGGTTSPGYYGGGGAGGFRENRAPLDSYSVSPLNGSSSIVVTKTAFPITVGAGGAGAPGSGNGSNSVFSTITSAGGGQGRWDNSTCGVGNGGSGGGGGGGVPGPEGPSSGGTGNTPPVTPPQGSPGGNGSLGPPRYGRSGGGGATDPGSNGSPTEGGEGGAGATTSISASPTTYAGGGGGGYYALDGCSPGARGAGGPGGGGNAAETKTAGGLNDICRAPADRKSVV